MPQLLDITAAYMWYVPETLSTLPPQLVVLCASAGGGYEAASVRGGSRLSVWHASPTHSESHAHAPLAASHTPFKEQSSSRAHAAGADAADADAADADAAASAEEE
jgi:hypothetical protein